MGLSQKTILTLSVSISVRFLRACTGCVSIPKVLLVCMELLWQVSYVRRGVLMPQLSVPTALSWYARFLSRRHQGKGEYQAVRLSKNLGRQLSTALRQAHRY